MRRTGWMAVALALVCPVWTGAPSAQARAGATSPGPRTSAAARAEAAQAGAQVQALTAEYRRRSSAAQAAMRDLAAAYSAVASTDADREAADAQVRADRARQAARVRALYVDGGTSLTAAVLDAGSVQDALWRLSVGRRVGEGVVREAGRALQTSEQSATLATDRALAADAATSAMARAADRLAEESEAAQLILRQAQARLATLSAQARRLRAAEEAAAALAEAQRAAASSTPVGPVTALGIPEPFEKAYRSAATTCPGLRWTLLAAVGQVESGHGRNNGPSSAGAIGPMQFMPATFAAYRVDGDGDGKADPWNYADAIPTAARYLCASGLDASDAGVQRALLAYNHAQWYVDLVLAAERAILARGA
ncbi:MAG: lytic transglycosylase domain-containing protein [Kineosporiaceae bacterium]